MPPIGPCTRSLRCAVHVEPSVQEHTVTVWLIDWENPENNVRRVIVDEMAVNPKYYETMSELLDALIE